MGMLKIFLILYADDIILFSDSAAELQKKLDILHEYCNRNRLTVLVFRKGGILPRDMKFYYDNVELQIVNTFPYLGIVFSSGGSFSECQKTLSGQGRSTN